jgi:hypothetical protein
MKRYLILFVLFAIGLKGYPQFWESFRDNNYPADADSLAQNHHMIAIAPPSVSINSSEEMDIRALLFQQETLSKDFQKETYNWMFKRRKQGKIAAEIQDVDTSNARLRRAGYFNGTSLSATEICRTLGVDGVIISDYTLSKPLSVGQALGTAIIGVAAVETSGAHDVPIGLMPHRSWPTLTGSMEIHDFRTNKMIWSNDHTLSVGVYSPSRVVNVLLSEKDRKMPYITK